MSCSNINERLYCMNCGRIVHGVKARSGKNKFLCPVCGSKMVELGRTRRSITIEMIAPNDYIYPEDDQDIYTE